MQPKPAELSTVTQYPACDHPDELLTSLTQILMSVTWKEGYKRSTTAELYHCAKCGRVINLGGNTEMTGDQLFDILAHQRGDVLEAIGDIEAQIASIRKVMEV